MRVARRFVVTGRVQGVGFRMFTREAAAVEGISGSVANREDGSVEVVAEGELDAMDRFERRLRSGPPLARVDDFAREDGAPTGRLAGFAIE